MIHLKKLISGALKVMDVSSNPIYFPSLNGTYRFIDSKRLHVKRTLVPKSHYNYTEVISNGWFIGKSISENPKIEARTTLGIKPLSANMVLYAPPFSAPDLYLHPGELELEFVVTKTSPPPNMPDYACTFLLDNNQDIISLSKDLFDGKRINPVYNLNYDSEVSSLALRAKKILDTTYQDPVKISDVAKKLKTSPAVLTRYFKHSYNITPIQYLNELRVKDALLIILGEKRGVLEASVDLGFNDQRQLYENFKKLFKHPPSHLQGAKKRNLSQPACDVSPL